MKKQHIISKNLKWVLLACVILGVAGGVAAVNPFEDIEYPVEELGNCQNREECKQFCDNPENMEPCLEFAKRVGLMSDREVEKAKKMATVGEMEGPGGCVDKDACEVYCDQIDNMRECIEFAEENDLIPLEELEEGKRVLRAIDQGITPPNCKGKSECDIYCSQVEHMEECIEFGIATGMMPPEEQIEAKKMFAALQRGVKPPNCNGKDECDVYCNTPEHMQECMEFSIEAGFMPPQEAEEAKKMLKALKAGIKPPNCQGERECDIYCSKPEHMEECMEFSIAAGFAPPGEEENMKRMLKAIKQGILPPDCRNDEECRVYCDEEENKQQCMDFSVAAGFMTEQEAEMMKKTGGKGPGGCMGEECKTFCDNIDNARECIQFGVRMGEISQEEADRMIRDMGGTMGPISECNTTKEECEEFCQSRNNENELICIQLRILTGEITQEEAGRIVEEKILQKGPGGPGGCRSIQECEDYCRQEEHMEECMRFTGVKVELNVAPMRIQPSIGGCKTPEECQEFCSKPENAQECMRIQGADGIIGSGQGEQWTPEDEERLKQDLQKEYGDDWQKIYDEKMRQRIDVMPPMIYEQGMGMGEVFREGTPQEGQQQGLGGFEILMRPTEMNEQMIQDYKEKFGDEWEDQYKQEFGGGIQQFQVSPEGQWLKPIESEDGGFRFAPGEVNEKIFDVEQRIREGSLQEGEWVTENTQIYKEGSSEPFLGELRQDIEYDVWQPPKEVEWQEPKQDEWIDTSDGGASESWGEFKVYEEPIPGANDWGVVEGDPGQWTDTSSGGGGSTGEWNTDTVKEPMPAYREPVPAYDSDYQDSIYQGTMPQPTAPISESNPQPMPQPEQPIYNIMPVPEPTYTTPAPEPSQGLLQPFKKFLGSIIEALTD